MADLSIAETGGIRQLPMWQIAIKLKEPTEANRNAIEGIVESLDKTTIVTKATKCLIGNYDKTYMLYQSRCSVCAEIFGEKAGGNPLVEHAYVDEVE